MDGTKTPGVYVQELSAFPPSVVGVATAVAAFIGYTEKAQLPDEGGPLLNVPTEISSMADYEAMFGGAAAAGESATPILWESMRLFFGNGGASAYIVSVGDFADFTADLGETGLDPHRLWAGLNAIGAREGATLLLAPDALAMAAADYHAFVVAMVQQASALGDRIAIIDVPGGGDPANKTPALIDSVVTQFRAGISAVGDGRSYGASYFPYLNADIDGDRRILPVSPAIAGIYALNDNNRGVWEAPANLSVSMAESLVIPITDGEQGDMNVPLDGLAVNAIRSFPGRGLLVWGARTLDGNSGDFRYIQVRRTIIYIEQSVKGALRSFVFQPNVAITWTAVTAMISDFLMSLWRQGGLMGSKASEAFSVSCGMGSTMTEEDVLSGTMRVLVCVSLIHPAEFIVLRFEQQVMAAG